MNFDNYTGNTFNGKNVVGMAINVNPSDYVAGIHNERLHLHDGGRARLTGSGTECWTNLGHCSSGMTVSIWYKATVLVYNCIAASGIQVQQEFSFSTHPDSGTTMWADTAAGRYYVKSSTNRYIS